MKLMKFKRVAVTVLIVLAAYLLQCTLFNHLELAGIKPNLILIVTASFGFMRGQKEGMLVGFFAGLITDIQFGTILGFYSLLYLPQKKYSFSEYIQLIFSSLSSYTISMKSSILHSNVLQIRSICSKFTLSANSQYISFIVAGRIPVLRASSA